LAQVLSLCFDGCSQIDSLNNTPCYSLDLKIKTQDHQQGAI
jgi:hypothetical protein